LKQQAKEFATIAHQGQYRKSSKTPYITHPVRVAGRLEQSGFPDRLVCAGYLHDVVEDTMYEAKDIEHRFGQRIAHLVAEHTEDKSKSWEERKQHTIDTVRDAEKEVKYLIVADKRDNLLAVERDMERLGNNIWQHFNAGYDKQKWYHQSIARNMYTGLSKNEVPPYFHEFEIAVSRVFNQDQSTRNKY